MMNKDDILAMSRAENRGSDEFEKQVLEKAGKLSAKVGLLMCCFIASYSVMRTSRMNNGCWAIYFSICATQEWTKYRHLHDRHALAMAVIATLVGLLFLGLFIAEMP